MLNNNQKFNIRMLRNTFSIAQKESLNINDIIVLHKLLTKYNYPEPQPSIENLKYRLLTHKFTQSDLIDEINYYSGRLDQRINRARHNNPHFERYLFIVANDNEKFSGDLGVIVEMLNDEPYKYMGFDAYSIAHIHWILQATGWTPRMLMDDIFGLQVERAILWEPPSFQQNGIEAITN